MGLADIIRSGVAVAHRVSTTLQVSVPHEAYAGQDGYKKPTYGPAVSRSGVLLYETKVVLDEHGKEQVSDAQLLFLSHVAVTTRDRFTLPDGRQPQILKVGGPADPLSAGGTYLTQVWFGGPRTS